MFFSLKQQLHASVLNAWFGDGGWTKLLIPLSLVFRRLALRRKARLLGRDRWEPPVPVVIVGNITVGGTGKTPVVASLVKDMQARGYHPGIVSRGFGVAGNNYPVLVDRTSTPESVGDEPVMLARQLDVPVVVDPDRVEAARFLYERCQCDLIIADDGLQHYNLKRHVELLVIDGQRMLGNGLCLPAGPLREPVERLETVDLVLTNGEPATDLGTACTRFNLVPQSIKPVLAGIETPSVLPAAGSRVHGVAGIGNPQRFFNTLSDLGYKVIPHAFPDHHQFQAGDILFDDEFPVIMTAKDAVKCVEFATSSHWYLPVATDIPATVFDHIASLIRNADVVKNG